ncbi:MAG: hypothetical protein ACO377_14990 [Pseudomonadales bacterium]
MRRVLSFGLLVAALGSVGAAIFVVSLLEIAPSTPTVTAPSPEDVAVTRRLVKEVREKTVDAAPLERDRLLALTEAEANGVLRVAARMFPYGRADVQVADGRVLVRASLRLPLPLENRWLNVEAVAPEFQGAPRLERVVVGGRSLPPEPLLAMARWGVNLVMGNRAGDVILGSTDGLVIQDDQFQVTLALREDDKSGFMDALFAAVRGEDMPSNETVNGYYVALRRAIDAGELPDRGSFLPHLRFVLARVLERSDDKTLANEYTAGVFALTKACGAREFSLIVGRLAGQSRDDAKGWQRVCDDVVFADRVDARRHFITAAALRAASNRGLSVSVGEFKELFDSLGSSRESGFDFSDIGADQSGIRLSDTIMTGTRANLESMLNQLQAESDVLVDIAQLPQIMPRAEFEARYGSIGSEAYAKQFADIEALIDAIAIH